MDAGIIKTIGRLALPLAHISIFIIFFWFGFLKLLGVSPANPLVEELLSKTLPFITFGQFILILGVYEMIIGVTFLIKGLERVALTLLIPHVIVTTLPLILLPQIAWHGAFSPTLEGQYIIKNLAIVALAFSLIAHIRPMGTERQLR